MNHVLYFQVYFSCRGLFRDSVDVVCMHARDVGICLSDCVPRTEFGVDALTCMQVSFWCVSSGNLIFGCCGQSPWVKTVIQNDGKLVLVSANRKTILTSLRTWLCICMCCILVIV